MTKRTKTVVSILLFIAVFGALLVTATFTDLQVSHILTSKALENHTYYTNETVFGVVFEAFEAAEADFEGDDAGRIEFEDV